MTCFGCATFMNLGARKARFAPGSFLIGSFLLCGSLYLAPYYRGPVQFPPRCIGPAGPLVRRTVLTAAPAPTPRALPRTPPNPGPPTTHPPPPEHTPPHPAP